MASFRLLDFQNIYEIYKKDMEGQYITNEKGQRIFTTKNTKPSAYFINYLHFLLEEENKKPKHFLLQFKNIVEANGHTFTLSDINKDNEDEDNIIEMENSNLYLMEVLEAPLINNSHLDMLDEKRIKREATHEDKVLMDKIYIRVR